MKHRSRGVPLLCMLLSVAVFSLEWFSVARAQESTIPDAPAPSLPGQDSPTPDSRAQRRQAGLIVFSGGDFDGRSLRVQGTLLDMPRETGENGEVYDWNDRISSMVVVRGTWRLYQNGRCNTELDETPLGELDLTTREAVGGWSCVVSAGRDGPVRLTFRDGLFANDDISSIERLSSGSLPAVARRPRSARAPEIEVFWDVDFGGRSLVIRESVGDLPRLTTETGEEIDWDDNISSIVVRGGTWRLCEGAGFNREGGWSVLISSRRRGEVRQSASECGGWTNDSISSIQLVSDTVMEEWAVLNREARARR